MATGADTPLLLCYDGSEPAKHAIERAADLLRTRHAVVLTVWQPTAGLGSFAWAGATENMLNYVELDRAAAELGGRIVSEGARVAQDAGMQAEPPRRQGHRTCLEDDPRDRRRATTRRRS